MLRRRYSTSDLPSQRTPKKDPPPTLSKNNPLLFFTNLERKLLAEQKKVVAYLAARRFFRNALDDIDQRFFGFMEHFRLLNLINMVDTAKNLLPQKMYNDFVAAHVAEVRLHTKTPDTAPEIEELFRVLVSSSPKDSQKFAEAIARANSDKHPREMSESELSRRKDLFLISDVFNAFAKCGAVESWRKVLEKVQPETRQGIIDKHGLDMLHNALEFKQTAFMHELLKYGVDVNALYESGHTMPSSQAALATQSALGFAVLGLMDILVPEQSRRDQYDKCVKFLTTNADGTTNHYQAKPFCMPDLVAQINQIKEIIALLQEHGADNTLRGYVDHLINEGTPCLPRKELVQEKAEELPTVSGYCEQLKQLPAARTAHMSDEVRKAWHEALDMIINAPSLEDAEVARPSI